MTVLRDRNTWLTKLERIKLLASQNQQMKFNNLGHIIDLEMLEEQYKEQNGKKAVGTDGITKEEYGKELRAIVNSGEFEARNDRVTPISNKRATSDNVTNFS